MEYKTINELRNELVTLERRRQAIHQLINLYSPVKVPLPAPKQRKQAIQEIQDRLQAIDASCEVNGNDRSDASLTPTH
jgi:hypothetical protein